MEDADVEIIIAQPSFSGSASDKIHTVYSSSSSSLTIPMWRQMVAKRNDVVPFAMVLSTQTNTLCHQKKEEKKKKFRANVA